MTATQHTESDIALYVHWPFCVFKCPYCDFNSHVVESVDHGAWCDAFLKELTFEAERLEATRLQSIFFGGGTPSLMDAQTVEAIIDAAQKHWAPIDDLEITLEANPGTVDVERFESFRHAGINRLSLGVQSLDDEQLSFLGRKHSVDDALRAITLAGETFDRLSFDLIYARPHQSEESWRDELSRALDVLRNAGGSHLSCYQLTIEDNTPFKTAYALGEFEIPDEDDGSSLYETTQEVLEDAGLPAYEISNHAEPGDACRHNMHVWQGGLYAGIGPGAHGRVKIGGTVHATRRHKPPAQWLKKVGANGYGTLEDSALTPGDRAIEMVLVGLRLSSGLNLAHLEHATGLNPLEVISQQSLESLESEGLITRSSDSLRTTEKGRLVLNSVIGALLG